MDPITQRDLRVSVISYPKVLCLTTFASTVEHCGARADRDLRGTMASRLRKAINLQRRTAFQVAVEKYKEHDAEVPTTECDRSLPYPKRILRIGGSQRDVHNLYPTPTSTGKYPRNHIIKSSTEVENPHNEWIMMQEHRLWVRLFDKYDRLLFNHADPQAMHVSQMIHLCTKLINHLNLISQTGEIEMQKALGTFEGTIIAQLTPPLDGKAQYHSWNEQMPDGTTACNVGAIAIINQNGDGIFNGQLIDDYIRTTFQLQ